jgi:hypothetical protein
MPQFNVTQLTIAPVKGLRVAAARELDITFGVWCEVVAPGRVRVGDAVHASVA